MLKVEPLAGAISDTPAARRHRVAIVGCGFGGLFAARALRRAEVDVAVIDRSNHHLFQPLLYQMATGILAEGDIAPPIRDILRNQRNATLVLGDVEGIDLDVRHLIVETLGQRSEVSYDSLILLLDAGPTILPTFPESLQRRAARTLESAGVEIHLGAMVTGVDQ